MMKFHPLDPIITGSIGPCQQYKVSSDDAGIPSIVAGNASVTSAVIESFGFPEIAVAQTLSQAGTLLVQRYVDKEGIIPVGAALSSALVANTPQTLIIAADNTPFQSFTIAITNSSATTATISGTYVLMQPAAGASSSTVVVSNLPAEGQATMAASLPVVVASNQSPLTTLSKGAAITQTVVTLNANTNAQILAANPNRRLLCVINIGTGLATLNFGATAATVGNGFPCAAAAGAGQQGGGLLMDAVVSTDAVQAISATGTVLAVLEGN